MRKFNLLCGALFLVTLVSGCRLTQGICDCDEKWIKPTCHTYSVAPGVCNHHGTPVHNEVPSYGEQSHQLPIQPAPAK